MGKSGRGALRTERGKARVWESEERKKKEEEEERSSTDTTSETRKAGRYVLSIWRLAHACFQLVPKTRYSAMDIWVRSRRDEDETKERQGLERLLRSSLLIFIHPILDVYDKLARRWLQRDELVELVCVCLPLFSVFFFLLFSLLFFLLFSFFSFFLFFLFLSFFFSSFIVFCY